MDNKKMQSLLDRAFSLISRIPVSGENVEVMAAAKNDLRAAYRLLTDAESGEKESEVRDNG